jgi:glycosyltransferase involved in cell wall biosynthesis
MEVAVVTSSLFEPLTTNPAYQIVRPFSYRPSQPKPVKAWRLARAIAPARRFLEEFRPDAVHAQGTVVPAIERRLYRSLKVPKVCTVHDARAHERRPWLGSFSRFYGDFDRLICHSESTRLRIQPALPTRSIAVVPHGIYSPLVNDIPEKAESRQRLGLPSGQPIVLFFGFIRRYKGLDLLLDALSLARRQGSNLMALVAGRPLYDISRSVERAEREGLPVAWHLGFIPRDEVATFFAAADVVALPYIDTFDSGALELAAAYGKPVVVTDAGGLPEAFARYGYGSLVAERTGPALARALLQQYSAPARPERSNTWEAVAERTAELYAEARRG